jgi:hypothetical protein
MKIEKHSQQSPQLILTLEGFDKQKNYYVFKNKDGKRIYLMEEVSAFKKPGYYTVYNSWEILTAELSRVPANAWSKDRWWSYCPAWAAYRPGFIHEKLKGYFNRQISKALEGVQHDELAVKEKTKLKTWMRACRPDQAEVQMALFN